MCCCCRRTYDVGLVLDGSYSVLDMKSEILVRRCCLSPANVLFISCERVVYLLRRCCLSPAEVLLFFPVWIEACVAVVEKFMMLVMFFDGVFSLDE